MSPEGGNHLRPLTHEHMARSEYHRSSLLAFRLRCHKSHGWPARRFGDGFGISGVVLLTFDEGLHIRRRHQPNLVVQGTDLSGPEMSRRTGFHSYNAARHLSQTCDHLTAREFLAEDNASVIPGDVKLKNPLCKVDSDNGNFIHGCLLLQVTFSPTSLWHIAMPSGGGIHPIRSQRKSTLLLIVVLAPVILVASVLLLIAAIAPTITRNDGDDDGVRALRRCCGALRI
jgi:hypothetical protein